MNSTVDRAWFFGDGVLLSEVVDELMKCGFVGVFYAEVVNN